MASSEVDQKFLGTFAKNIGTDNPLLSSMLFKVLGLSVLLSKQLVSARNPRKRDSISSLSSLDLYLHIIWLSREGLRIVEQYVIPMVSTFSELKVLSYKLRASFYHVYVLFHNQPSVDAAPTPPRRPSTPPGLASTRQTKVDKGKAPALGSPIPDFGQSSMHTPLEGGPVGGIHSTNTEPPTKSPPANFLVPAQDFIPVAFSCFQEASNLSEKLLWGSHPLRLSVKVEFAAFLYDCMQDYDASRNMAKATITEVYKAQEGMDDEMFQDAADLVSVLGGMANRGIGRGGERAYDSSNESTPIKSGSSQSSDRTIGPSGNAASAEEPPQAPIIHTPIIQAPTPQAPSPRTPIAQAPPTDQDPHTQTPNLQVPGVSQVPQPAFPSPDMVNPI